MVESADNRGCRTADSVIARAGEDENVGGTFV